MRAVIRWFRETIFQLLILGLEVFLICSIMASKGPRPSKARQSEAKIALAAIYGAEKSFYTEYAAYAGSMDAIGYAPEGQRRFYSAGFSSEHVGRIKEYKGTLTRPYWEHVNDTFTCKGTPAPLGPPLVGHAQSFVAVATGCVRKDSKLYDTWHITDQKVIANDVYGL